MCCIVVIQCIFKYNQIQIHRRLRCSDTNAFINFWLRFFDTRRETILKSLSYHIMLPTSQRSAHLVVQSQSLNTMVGPQFFNNMIGPQFLNPMVGPQFLNTMVRPQFLNPMVGPQFLNTMVGPQFLNTMVGPQFLNTMIGSQFLNTMIRPQFLNTMVLTQLQPSASMADNPTVYLHGPKSTPNWLFFKIFKFSGPSLPGMMSFTLKPYFLSGVYYHIYQPLR